MVQELSFAEKVEALAEGSSPSILPEGQAICAWCKKVLHDAPDIDGISHGMCKDCAEKLSLQIKDHPDAEKKKKKTEATVERSMSDEIMKRLQRWPKYDAPIWYNEQAQVLFVAPGDWEAPGGPNEEDPGESTYPSWETVEMLLLGIDGVNRVLVEPEGRPGQGDAEGQWVEIPWSRTGEPIVDPPLNTSGGDHGGRGLDGPHNDSAYIGRSAYLARGESFESMVELAEPLPSHLDTTYYHATSKEDFGEQILAAGTVEPSTPKKRGRMSPRSGYAYMSPSLETAAIYALGGVMMGSDDYWASGNAGDRYGYIFEIDGSQLQDVDPDEDNVGEFLGTLLNRGLEDHWLVRMARSRLRDTTIRKVMDGEYAYWASAGKQLLQRMPDNRKQELMSELEDVAHLGHKGAVQWRRAYRLDKARSGEINEDGSNVLEIAELINDRAGDTFESMVELSPESIGEKRGEFRVIAGEGITPEELAEGKEALKKYAADHFDRFFGNIVPRYEFVLERIQESWREKIFRFDLQPRKPGRQASGSFDWSKPVHKYRGLDNGTPVDDIESDPNMAYRGMAFEEWQESQRSGRTQGGGDYSFPNQEGLTLFGDNFSTAAYYAGGFAPVQHIPVRDRPGVVIEVPKNLLLTKSNFDDPHTLTTNELASDKPLSTESITRAWYIVPEDLGEGMLDVIVDKLSGKAREGSRQTPTGSKVAVPIELGVVDTFESMVEQAEHIKLVNQHLDTIGGGSDSEHKYQLVAVSPDVEPGVDDTVVGILNYTLFQDTIHIDMIEVHEDYRRQGIGTKLVQGLKAEWPDNEVEWGMTTPDGTELQTKTEPVESMVESSDIFSDGVKRYFGVTSDPQEAGYILADGSWVDLSGKKHGGTPGMRSHDHREIWSAFEDDDDVDIRGGSEGMWDFMSESGAIRLMPENGAVTIVREPTAQQYQSLNSWWNNFPDWIVEVEPDEGVFLRGAQGPRLSHESGPDDTVKKMLGRIRRFFSARKWQSFESMVEVVGINNEKSWYNTKTDEEVPLTLGDHHSDAIFKEPELFGITGEEAEQYRSPDDSLWTPELFNAIGTNGWVRVIVSKRWDGLELNLSGVSRQDLYLAAKHYLPSYDVTRLNAEWPNSVFPSEVITAEGDEIDLVMRNRLRPLSRSPRAQSQTQEPPPVNPELDKIIKSFESMVERRLQDREWEKAANTLGVEVSQLKPLVIGLDPTHQKLKYAGWIVKQLIRMEAGEDIFPSNVDKVAARPYLKDILAGYEELKKRNRIRGAKKDIAQVSSPLELEAIVRSSMDPREQIKMDGGEIVHDSPSDIVVRVTDGTAAGRLGGVKLGQHGEASWCTRMPGNAAEYLKHGNLWFVYTEDPTTHRAKKSPYPGLWFKSAFADASPNTAIEGKLEWQDADNAPVDQWWIENHGQELLPVVNGLVGEERVHNWLNEIPEEEAEPEYPEPEEEEEARQSFLLNAGGYEALLDKLKDTVAYDADDLLATASIGGMPLAVIRDTMADYVEEALDSMDIADLFSAIEDTGVVDWDYEWDPQDRTWSASLPGDAITNMAAQTDIDEIFRQLSEDTLWKLAWKTIYQPLFVDLVFEKFADDPEAAALWDAIPDDQERKIFDRAMTVSRAEQEIQDGWLPAININSVVEAVTPELVRRAVDPEYEQAAQASAKQQLSLFPQRPEPTARVGFDVTQELLPEHDFAVDEYVYINSEWFSGTYGQVNDTSGWILPVSSDKSKGPNRHYNEEEDLWYYDILGEQSGKNISIPATYLQRSEAMVAAESMPSFESITERLMTALSDRESGLGQYSEIFANPGGADMREIRKGSEGSEFRGLILQDGTVVAWGMDTALHIDVMRKLEKEVDPGAMTTSLPIYIDGYESKGAVVTMTPETTRTVWANRPEEAEDFIRTNGWINKLFPDIKVRQYADMQVDEPEFSNDEDWDRFQDDPFANQDAEFSENLRERPWECRNPRPLTSVYYERAAQLAVDVVFESGVPFSVAAEGLDTCPLPEKKGPKWQTLQNNRKPLSDEERTKVMDADAIWHHGPSGKASPAVWKSEVGDKTWYVTNTHRATASRPSLKGAISIYHSLIKGTS